jgi:hypothetical protein
VTRRCPVCHQPYAHRVRTRKCQDVTLGEFYRHRHGAYTYLHQIQLDWNRMGVAVDGE